MIKTSEWYCFKVASDIDTIFDLDYLLTGLDPENVNFEARQNNQKLKQIFGQRSAQIELKSIFDNEPIEFCWQKTDRKSKKLDFTFKRNMAHS